MRILIVSQYFWPESFIINDVVGYLRKLGHTVSIATGKPNYPDGKIFTGYSEKGIQHEIFKSDIEVLRVPLRPRCGGTPREIVRNYLSFVVSGLRWFSSRLKGKKFDIILVYAPSPITMAIPAIWLKLRTGTPLAIWVQDLWPESLSATGFVKSRFILACTGLMVRGIYAFSDILLVQSRSFIEPVARYANRKKIIYYPNSSEDIQAGQHNSSLPQELIKYLEANFCLVFAGNIGTAQSVETLVEACVRLRKIPDFRLVVVGSGNMLSWLEQQKQSRALDNMHLVGRFPPHEMWPIFSRASALLVSLKKREIFSYTIPSKVQNYLAAGKPIIGALDGEGARIIEEAGAGLTSGAEDVEGLARNIEKLYQMNSKEREELGCSGRSYFLEHFEMQSQVDNLVNLLQRRLDSKGTERA